MDVFRFNLFSGTRLALIFFFHLQFPYSSSSSSEFLSFIFILQVGSILCGVLSIWYQSPVRKPTLIYSTDIARRLKRGFTLSLVRCQVCWYIKPVSVQSTLQAKHNTNSMKPSVHIYLINSLFIQVVDSLLV